MRHASLTGSWSGVYRYQYGKETVFNAQIDEVAGAFIGTTQEPNNEDPHLKISVLTADIEGVRSGSTVTFTKFYTGEAAQSYAIRYEGEVDAALTRIEGRWIVPPNWTGTFFMVRDDEGAAAEAKETAEAEMEVRR